MTTAADIRRAIVAIPGYDRAADVQRSLMAGDREVREAVFAADPWESGLSSTDYQRMRRGHGLVWQIKQQPRWED